MGSIQRSDGADLDVIIIGAGISGINAAYRVQTELPNYSYKILESRHAIGGTWDLFRYPGIRSDSDLHTFGFPWRPWSKPNAIADGESIRTYLRESAEHFGIDRKIDFHHKLVSTDWSTKDQRWNLIVDSNGVEKEYSARFIIFGTGYYDYKEPLKASIPGIENFKGQVIHPQFWPEDLDYTGKRIVIIGSGATAITLLPNLVDKAAHVTMLQRSPTYIMALPAVDPLGDWIRKWFPTRWAHTLVRWKFLILPFIFFSICRKWPNAGRKTIRKNQEAYLPKDTKYDPDFNPSYGPWEQRLCVCPDGDFFKAITKKSGSIVTDTITNITADSIQTKSGKTLDTDIIVTATGLKMQLAGGAVISIDGKPVAINEKFMWKGVMLQDVPNAAMMIGYTNASWTLGSDITALQCCRLLKHMDRNNQSSAIPRVPKGREMKHEPLLNLSSTYIEKAKGSLPSAGDIAPWKPRQSYLTDLMAAQFGSLTKGLEFS